MQCEADVTQQQQMERYLVERHDSAATSFAQELAAKDEQYTRFWQYTGLPMKPSHLRLDGSKLEGEGLLDPGALAVRGECRQECTCAELCNAAAKLHAQLHAQGLVQPTFTQQLVRSAHCQ